MPDFALVAMVAGGTLLMRISLVSLLAGVTIPEWLEQALRLLVPAVLAGLVAQTLFISDAAERSVETWYLALVVAAIVAWRTRSVGWTLLVGMITVWVLEAVGQA